MGQESQQLDGNVKLYSLRYPHMGYPEGTLVRMCADHIGIAQRDTLRSGMRHYAVEPVDVDREYFTVTRGLLKEHKR